MVSTINATLNRAATAGGASPPVKIALKEKMRIFWISLYTDYRDVFLETFAEGRAKPGKSFFYLSAISGLFYALATNPGAHSYFQNVTKMDTELSLVAKPIRNPKAEAYLHQIRRLEMKGVLRHTNVAFFSFIWRDNENPEAGIYHAKCKYVKPRWTEVIRERVVDVGVGGRWWVLERNMQDFDVNPKEWEEKTEDSSLFSFIAPVVKA